MVAPAGTRGTVGFLVSFVCVLPPSFVGLVSATDDLQLVVVRSSSSKSQRKGTTVSLLLCSAMFPGQSSGATKLFILFWNSSL